MCLNFTCVFNFFSLSKCFYPVYRWVILLGAEIASVLDKSLVNGLGPWTGSKSMYYAEGASETTEQHLTFTSVIT